jgi:PBSX family phage portal protein
MTDDVKGTDKPSGQVYRLTSLTKVDKFQKFVRPASPEAPDGAIQANALSPEDEYQDLYVGATRDQGILEPPYRLRHLDRLAQENNALSPCVEAMVTNIDGTGYDFSSKDDAAEDKDDDSNIEALREFFGEPWPGESFVTIRKNLRRDLERTGNAYLEVLRNPQGEVTFFRHVDAKMMRLLKLDTAIPVVKTLRRNGADQKVTVMERQRRYCQLVNGVSLVYFKDFGVERDLDKGSAAWAIQGQRLPASQRATEIIHFTALPDARTPYGVPRWINQLPSVLGSRKAEEFNLDFFDNGGVPPALVILQGGTLQSETRKALEGKFMGPAEGKNRVQVLEVEPSGGSMDRPTQAKVTVERFGGERQNDSMFEQYDERCELRVRRSFRLAPIFVGAAQDYSFASAYVSYTVTEAQVFKPERDEFDEVITMTLLSAMGYGDYKLVSKPLTIEDVNMKLQGIELAMGTQAIELDDVINEINEACGTKIKFSQQAVDEAQSAANPATYTVDENGDIITVNDGKSGVTVSDKAAPKVVPTPKIKPGKVNDGSSMAVKAEHPGILALAQDTLIALRERNFAELSKNVQLVSTLDDAGRAEFQKATASLQFIDPAHDHEGLGELMGCTLSVMQRAHTHAH